MQQKTTFPIPTSALARIGLSPEEICAAAGVDNARLSALGTQLSLDTQDFFKLWSWAESRVAKQTAGLQLGANGIAEGYGIAARVALHAPTFGWGLAALSRYKQLVCPELIEVAVEGDMVSVRYRWLLATGPAPRLLVDMTLASLAQLAVTGTQGHVTPLRIDLARRAEGQAYVADHFNCPVTFGQEVDAMVFDRSALDVAMVTADQAPFEAEITDLEKRLKAGEGEQSAGAILRMTLAKLLSLGQPPNLAEAADRMHVSRRSLQRRLKDAGTSFQAELAGVRHVIAQRLLLNTELDPVAISMLLGFAEPNSFTRQFRSWEQTTPLRWRAMNGA